MVLEALATDVAQTIDKEGPRGGHRLIFLTAHTGTGLFDSVNKILARTSPPDAPTLGHVNLDNAVVRAALGLPDADPAAGTVERLSHLHPEAFDLDQRTLLHAWRQGLSSSEAAIRQLLVGGDVIVTLSATFYHRPSRSVFSPIDSQLLERMFSTSRCLVVTMIDDVYDAFARLSVTGSGEIFDPTLWTAGHGDALRRSSVIRTLLEWRQAEIRGAQRMARSVYCEHVLFSAKQPLDTFDRIRLGRPVCYLSTPFTWPRQRSDDSHTVEWATQLTEQLRSADEIALLEPRAIDEDRFVTDSAGRVTSTELTAHHLGYDRLLANEANLVWAGLGAAERATVESPFADATGRGDFPWPNEEPAHLDHLRDEIRNHTISRNRLLVNHAYQALFMIRPYLAEHGQLRRGARVEIEVWNGIRTFEREHGKNTERPRRLVLFERMPDERSRRRSALLAAFYRGRSQAQPLSLEGDRAIAGAHMNQVLDVYDELDGDGETHGPDAAMRLGAALEQLVARSGNLLGPRPSPGAEDASLDAAERTRRIGQEILRCIEEDFPDEHPWTRSFFRNDVARRIGEHDDIVSLCRELVSAALGN